MLLTHGAHLSEPAYHGGIDRHLAVRRVAGSGEWLDDDRVSTWTDFGQ
ncbi:MAG: hypothetical protein H6737_23270 [Alphaproteobacteria bacterium]|nr:hypothetical protein [Alphaproteobacteria bacterium]